MTETFTKAIDHYLEIGITEQAILYKWQRLASYQSNPVGGILL